MKAPNSLFLDLDGKPQREKIVGSDDPTLPSDWAVLRRRVLNDELALAADVFDREPLPLHDPLLGCHNVVHTPHNTGRITHANQSYAEALLDQFEPGKPYQIL